MDKLRPILKQKYWICFGLALIFVLYGWWAASAELTTKILERKTSVEASFKEALVGDKDPNELWVAAGNKENEEDALSYKKAALQLWRRQQKVREWPEQISSKMHGVAYFAEIATRETRDRWRSIYQRQIEDLIKIVKPFENHTGNGLVVFDANRITKQDYNKWQVNLPSSNEIWSNQEDIWLLKALLTSIAKTNDSATRITESQVREIKRLHLRGGDRNTMPDAMTGAGGMGMGMGNASGMGGLGFRDVDKDDDRGGGGGATMSGAALAGGQTHPGTPFVGGSGGDILAEEFGGRGGAAGFAGGTMGFRDVDSDKESGGRGMGMGAAAPEVRYVDGADSDIGYKTRAFLLDVVIQDERLPDLLAKLTNSDFPVEIIRVEVTPHAATGGGGFGGMMTGTNVDDDEDRKGGRLGGIAGLGGAAFGGGGNGGFGGGGFGGGGFGGGGFNQPALGGPGFGGNIGLYGNANGLEVEVSPLDMAKATEALNAAMSDPSLIDVNIGGLLTLYMTPEETEMQAKAEESDAKEAAAAAPAATSDATSSAGTSDSVPTDEVPTDTVPDASEALPQADVTNPEQPAEPPTEQPTDQAIDQSTKQPADTSAEPVDAPVP